MLCKPLVRLFLAGVCTLAMSGLSHAGTCTATSTYSNPDATLTNSSSCGVGILNDNNDSATDLNTLNVGGFTNWVQLNRVDAPGSDDGDLHVTGANPGSSAGDWAFDAAAGYNSFTLVIKNGGTPGGNQDSIYWAWFVVDLTAGCSSGSFSGSYDYCGSWTMYGDNGNLKEISHMTLYGSESSSSGGPSAGNAPEPGSSMLVGLALGMMGLGFRARQKRLASEKA
jgi:PEP-CTERM motif